MAETEKNNLENKDSVSTDTIFDELDFWDDVKVDEEKKDEELEKLKKYWLISSLTFWILFVVFIFSLFYTHVNTAENRTFAYLNTICSIFISWYEQPGDCRGVASLSRFYQTTLEDTKEDTVIELLDLIPRKYSLESFTGSPEVVFLLEKTNLKSDPVEILSQFDAVKNNFSSIDKNSIQCKNITITSEWFFNIDCDIYSSLWNPSKRGTSISIASEFQRFLEESPEFSLINKQSEFRIESVSGERYFTQKTPLSLTLQYEQWEQSSF